MTSIVTDFKSIARKLNCQEQKAEFEEKNPKVEPSMYGWPYGVAVPFGEPNLKTDPELLRKLYQQAADCEALRCRGETVVVKAPLKSMAHPEWPYTGTPFEWSKFVKVKI